MIRLDIQFRCPKCNGHMFSSYDCGTPQGMTRYCTSLRLNGDNTVCKTKFHERDDWKYFVINLPGIRRFKNRDEYELVMDIVRAQMGGSIAHGVLA
jgi:hypothetical protein